MYLHTHMYIKDFTFLFGKLGLASQHFSYDNPWFSNMVRIISCDSNLKLYIYILNTYSYVHTLANIFIGIKYNDDNLLGQSYDGFIRESFYFLYIGGKWGWETLMHKILSILVIWVSCLS